MSLNILVVDDSAVSRSMVLKTLRLSGVPVGTIHQAANGQEALETLEHNWVDMILTDLNMPVVNGEELVHRVRANPLWQSLPVIVISTEGSQTRIARLTELGARFVHKPFSPEQLGGVVQEITGVCHE